VYSTGTTRPVVPPADVTLDSVIPNGGSGTATAELTLVFSDTITRLSADDITLSMPGPFGVTKGTLSGDGPSYTLGVSSLTDGTVTVSVRKTGYNISGSPAEVTISNDGGGGIPALVEDQWTNGTLSSATSVNWYKITVSASTTYRIWWNDNGYDGGDGTKTGDVVVGAWYANETNIFGNSTEEVDNGWGTPQQFTPLAGGTVYVRVMPYNGADQHKGTYGIVFSTGATMPD
jgi:hypothetical protein